MADIRRTGVLDSFTDVYNPAENGPNWDRVASFSSAVQTGSGLMKPSGAGDATYYWVPTEGQHSGDIECWGRTWDVADETEAWRVGLMRQVDPAATTVDGYLCLAVVGIGGFGCTLRKYTDGGFTNIASGTGTGGPPGIGSMLLLRRNGSDVEIWDSNDSGANWEMVCSATDTDYMTDMSLVLGISSDDGTGPGWEEFGGGPVEGAWFPQYVRRVMPGPFVLR